MGWDLPKYDYHIGNDGKGKHEVYRKLYGKPVIIDKKNLLKTDLSYEQAKQYVRDIQSGKIKE